MDLEVVEMLALGEEGSTNNNNGSLRHWSQNTARPHYSLTKEEVKEAAFTNRFTCFDVAERIEADHDVLFAGRSNGSVVLWRMIQRNTFGGSSRNDRVEESFVTSSPHKGSVTCITHTPPSTFDTRVGPLVFSGSTDHTVKVWNAWGGSQLKETCLQTMAEQRGGVTALAFAGDDTLVASSRDGSIRLWRPQHGRKLLRYPFFCSVKCLLPYSPQGGAVSRPKVSRPLRTFVSIWCTTACVTGDDEWTLYCGDSDGTVSVFQRTRTSVAERVANAGKQPNDQTSQQLADSEVTLQRRWGHLHSLAITKLALVPEHNFLVSIGNDGVCKILDCLKGSVFSTFGSKTGGMLTSAAWDLAHEQLVMADVSGVVQIWNTYTGSMLLRKQVAKPVTTNGPRRGYSAPALLGLFFSKTDGMLYGMSPSEDCFFRWKIVKVKGHVVLGHHGESIVGLGFQEAMLGGRRASTSETRTTIFANVDRQNTKAYQPDEDQLDDGTSNEEEKIEDDLVLTILSVSVDGKIVAWDAVGKSERYYMQHRPDEEVASMLVLPGGQLMATGTGNGNVRFWRLDTGAGQSFEAHSNTVSALATGKNWCGSLILASGGFDGAIVVWMADAKDGIREDRIPQVNFVLRGAHGAADGSNCEVLCLAFIMLSDTALLASAGNDFVVKCWRIEATKGALVATLKGHSDSIEALIADGLHILSAGYDGTVRVWSVSGCALGEGKQESLGTDDSGSRIICVGTIEAHPSGVVDMAIVSSVAAIHSGLPMEELHGTASKDDGGIKDVNGLLVTCGKVEGVIKIWDYTHVEEDGTSCGRLVRKISSPDESIISCVACLKAVKGGFMLFAGTTEGIVMELSWNVTGDASGADSYDSSDL